MDIWERCARKATVNLSECAVGRLNAFTEEGRAFWDARIRHVKSQVYLTLILVMTNSGDRKAVDWASAQLGRMRKASQ